MLKNQLNKIESSPFSVLCSSSFPCIESNLACSAMFVVDLEFACAVMMCTCMRGVGHNVGHAGLANVSQPITAYDLHVRDNNIL